MSEISKLNNLFGERYRKNPFGNPLFKWVLNTELWHPMRTGQEVAETSLVGVNGQPLVNVIPVFQKRLQLLKHDKDGSLAEVWVLAKWFSPELSEHQWEKLFGTQLQYPTRGYYIMIFHLPIGQKPSRALTEEVIASLKKTESITDEEYQRQIEREEAEDERVYDNFAHSVITNALPAFCRIPGSQGGHVEFMNGSHKKEKENNASKDHQHLPKATAGHPDPVLDASAPKGNPDCAS